MGESRRKRQVTLEGGPALEDWRFAKENTTYLVHGLHDYPARMIPQIAERLLNLYTEKGDTVLDPFCGSGTTLVEASLAGRNSYGIDINPLATLIASVKTTPIDFRKEGFNPTKFLHELENKYHSAKDVLPSPPTRILPNLLHWFKKSVASDLEFLYREISRVRGDAIRNLLKVVFSATVFSTSNIDHRSSRFIRTLSKEQLDKFNPNVLSEFHKNLVGAVERIEGYVRKLRLMDPEVKIKAQVYQLDARQLPFPEESVDTIITSPPYGEEKNTVGYVRWAKLSIAWLRLDDHKIKEIQKKSLGAIKRDAVIAHLEELPTKTAKQVLFRISKVDLKRVEDALPFFFDYLETLQEMYRVLRKKSCCCIVIGNRSIRKIPLDMEKVTVELANEVGFTHKRSFYREIPMKLIPWSTPTGKTISKENIIILEKM